VPKVHVYARLRYCHPSTPLPLAEESLRPDDSANSILSFANSRPDDWHWLAQSAVHVMTAANGLGRRPASAIPQPPVTSEDDRTVSRFVAEADIEYDAMKEMDDINGEFGRTDVTIFIGANDVTNPAARNDPSSPIHGMPILNVDVSRSVIVLKRSMSSGYAGIENPLFFLNHTSMPFGDAKKSVSHVIEELKAL
jgi:NAD(P) transhydrogenase beta subunit